MRLTVRYVVLVVIFGAVGIALSVSGDGAGGFWSSHQMFASIVSGVFLLLFAALLFEDVLRRRDNGRWKEVQRLACHVLADQVTRGVVVELAALYGGAMEALPRWQARPRWGTESLDPLNEIGEIPAGKTTVSIFRDEALATQTPPPNELVNRERLRALIENQEWCMWAVGVLRARRERGRERISRWAPLLVAAEEPRAILNYVSALNEQVGYLRQALERRIQAELAGDAAEPWVLECTRLWQLLDARARLLTNELWRRADEGHFGLLVPFWLTDTSLADAFRDPEAVGEWKPEEPRYHAARIGRWA